jgi:hypothetical protein
LAVLLLLTVPLLAAPPSTDPSTLECGPEYLATIAAIEKEQLAQGVDRKLTTKIENAWRLYQSGDDVHQGVAVQDLDTALQLLDSQATQQISPEVKERIRQPISALRNCFLGVPPINLATLTVRTFFADELTGDEPGAAAGAGVLIRVDGAELGVTGADGTVTLQVPTGPIAVEARLYPSHLGQAEVDLLAGTSATIDLILEDGKELAEDTRLVLTEAPNGVLDRAFTSFRLRFLDGDAPVPLTRVWEIELLHPDGDNPVTLNALFALQADGSVGAIDVQALRNLLFTRVGALEIRIVGEDERGRTHANVVRFYLSRFRVVGHLLPPPSAPGLATGGIFITAAILNTDLVFHAVSDAAGNFEFPLLPQGNLEFSAQTVQDGRYYYGQGVAVLNRDLSLSVNMLHTDDLINGVPGYSETTLLAATFAESTASSSSRELLDAVARAKGGEPLLLTAEALSTASLLVVAAAQNFQVFNTATLDVPKGTKEVTLTYTVQTDEYPYYVLSQSVYNDVWNLAVRGGSGGQQIFNVTRQINSQLAASPVWQGDGTTGEIKETLNVEALAAQADITLTVYASSMNVGDSILPTRVQGSLGAAPAVRINSITPDTVNPTTGDSKYYSIPRSGRTNNYARRFTLKITKPPAATIEKLTVTLLGPGALMTVLDEGIGDNVVRVDDETLRVRVTMHSNPSSVSSQPPPTHDIKYRFKLTVKEDGTESSDQKDSSTRHALWRMPDGFGRYSPTTGAREAGGDDWASRGAYNWMATNRALLTRINDVSGEHARNIGHNTHQYGTDIDMFHFYTFPNGAGTGTANYLRLIEQVRLAVRTNSPDPAVRQQAQEARTRLIAWVNATRDGVDDLAALNTVSRVIYADGDATTGLAQGWARSLIDNGRTTVGGTALDLGLAAWTNAKFRSNDVHNNHVHVTLNRAALGN